MVGIVAPEGDEKPEEVSRGVVQIARAAGHSALLVHLRPNRKKYSGHKKKDTALQNARWQLETVWGTHSAQPENSKPCEETCMNDLVKVDAKRRLHFRNAPGWEGHRRDDPNRPEDS